MGEHTGRRTVDEQRGIGLLGAVAVVDLARAAHGHHGGAQVAEHHAGRGAGTTGGTKLADVREVYSHGQAIAQCAGFIEAHGLHATKYPNTAMSAEMVANSERTDVAAIASRSCAALYGLEVLEPNIQDSDNNYTRFVVISREPRVYPGANRTSLMITTANEPGALYRVLERFYALNINLIKLESRPIPGHDFEFMFYFDLDCPFGSKALDDLLDSIDDVCESFTYFGSYTEVL